MEVHVLLLTDMLLICKPTTKKMLKIIRQPYVVDRIRIHEVKEPSSLGLVYLNEYGTVSAALILSAGDPKLTKVTRQTATANYDEFHETTDSSSWFSFRSVVRIFANNGFQSLN